MLFKVFVIPPAGCNDVVALSLNLAMKQAAAAATPGVRATRLRALARAIKILCRVCVMRGDEGRRVISLATMPLQSCLARRHTAENCTATSFRTGAQLSHPAQSQPWKAWRRDFRRRTLNVVPG